MNTNKSRKRKLKAIEIGLLKVGERVNPYNLEWVMFRDECNEEEAKKTILLFKELTSTNLKTFLRKYGSELGLKKYNEKLTKSKQTLENFIIRYGEEKGGKEWNLFRGRKDNSSFSSMVCKYGPILGFINYFKKIEKTKHTLKTNIKRYGLKKGTIAWEKYITKKSFTSSREGLTFKHGTQRAEEICFSKRVPIERIGEEKHKLRVQKQRLTKTETGNCIDYSMLEDFEHYTRLVRNLTSTQNIGFLLFSNKRGIACNNTDAYHLDHKISIFAGFQNNMPIHIIGGVENLQFLHYKENIQKRTNSYSALYNIRKIINENNRN